MKYLNFSTNHLAAQIKRPLSYPLRSLARALNTGKGTGVQIQIKRKLLLNLNP